MCATGCYLTPEQNLVSHMPQRGFLDTEDEMMQTCSGLLKTLETPVSPTWQLGDLDEEDEVVRKQLAQRPVFWLRMFVLAVVTGLLAAGLVLYFLRARGCLARPVLCMTNAVSMQVWNTCTRPGMSHVLLVTMRHLASHASALPCFAMPLSVAQAQVLNSLVRCHPCTCHTSNVCMQTIEVCKQRHGASTAKACSLKAAWRERAANKEHRRVALAAFCGDDRTGLLCGGAGCEGHAVGARGQGFPHQQHRVPHHRRAGQCPPWQIVAPSTPQNTVCCASR